MLTLVSRLDGDRGALAQLLGGRRDDGHLPEALPGRAHDEVDGVALALVVEVDGLRHVRLDETGRSRTLGSETDLRDLLDAASLRVVADGLDLEATGVGDLGDGRGEPVARRRVVDVEADVGRAQWCDGHLRRARSRCRGRVAEVGRGVVERARHAQQDDRDHDRRPALAPHPVGAVVLVSDLRHHRSFVRRRPWSGGPVSGEYEDSGVKDRTQLQRGAQCPVQPVLEVELALPLDTVREEVPVERRVVSEESAQVERALGRDELAELHHPRRDVRPVLGRLESMVWVRARVADGLENHRVSIGVERGRPATRVRTVTETAGSGAPQTGGTGDTSQIDEIRAGYAFEGGVLKLGAAVVDGQAHADAPVQIPLSVLNRHGLVAGATGTGKTKTLQLMAAQLADQGVPVFLADMKGDLSGLATPGEGGDKITSRAADVGMPWTATAYPTEFYSLGGKGDGIAIRATITGFGPTLLSKVLGLNDTQESSLGLIFHYADKNGLALLDLKDLRAVISHLTSDEGKADLKDLGGLSSATAGVILRNLITFEDQGAGDFFGEPEFETSDLLRTASDGKGMISCLELPQVQDRPQLFSTFLMWMLADLFHDLPEEGDLDKPKLVFFFDEAHLLFDDASKAFLQAIEHTVRLIRSKGVGVFFVTQSPTDVPDDVLGQLGSRIQHQLRAHTPNDAKALKATVNTYPNSAYDDLGAVITSLGIGEAVVTVMNERGAPTPVAWTRLRAPESLMGPADPAAMSATVDGSPLKPKYGEAVDRESAREKLAARLEAGAAAAHQEAPKREDH